MIDHRKHGSLGVRVRRAATRKIPYLGVIGAREMAAGEVALRQRDGRRLGVMLEGDAISVVSDRGERP